MLQKKKTVENGNANIAIISLVEDLQELKHTSLAKEEELGVAPIIKVMKEFTIIWHPLQVIHHELRLMEFCCV
jgi:hypothetical protein